MHFRAKVVTAFVLFLLPATVLAQHSGVRQNTRAFLDAYVSGNSTQVRDRIDRENVTMYGADVAEIAHGADEVLRMMAMDQRLWQGGAKIGTMRHVSVSETPGQASIFFDAPFSVGNQPPVDVRFCLVWKKEAGRWLLVQSSNTIPTVHQSASELLHSPEAH